MKSTHDLLLSCKRECRGRECALVVYVMCYSLFTDFGIVVSNNFNYLGCYNFFKFFIYYYFFLNNGFRNSVILSSSSIELTYLTTDLASLVMLVGVK